jgi:hypothetical protein
LPIGWPLSGCESVPPYLNREPKFEDTYFPHR